MDEIVSTLIPFWSNCWEESIIRQKILSDGFSNLRRNAMESRNIVYGYKDGFNFKLELLRDSYIVSESGIV